MLSSDPQNLITQLEADPFLFEPDQIRRRIDALDDLDAHLGGSDSTPLIQHRAGALRTRIEAANSDLYESMRSEIRRGAQPQTLLSFFNQTKSPSPGLSYDYLDELLSGVLKLHEPHEANMPRRPEMVFYQPTPARHILQLIKLTDLSAIDELVDLGSGLGHAALLASILSGCAARGIEVEASYAAIAQKCAHCLRLNRVTFTHADVRTADLSTGTVFYLYTPFTGSILSTVLSCLREQSAIRPIKICTLGPCTTVVAAESWLTAITTPDPGRVALFQSRNRA